MHFKNIIIVRPQLVNLLVKNIYHWYILEIGISRLFIQQNRRGIYLSKRKAERKNSKNSTLNTYLHSKTFFNLMKHYYIIITT